VRDADEIIVMKGGEVKERGKHAELLALNGVYTKLVGRQLVSLDGQNKDAEGDETPA